VQREEPGAAVQKAVRRHIVVQDVAPGKNNDSTARLEAERFIRLWLLVIRLLKSGRGREEKEEI
jgi:hypothetical protein